MPLRGRSHPGSAAKKSQSIAEKHHIIVYRKAVGSGECLESCGWIELRAGLLNAALKLD